MKELFVKRCEIIELSAPGETVSCLISSYMVETVYKRFLYAMSSFDASVIVSMQVDYSSTVSIVFLKGDSD